MRFADGWGGGKRLGRITIYMSFPENDTPPNTLGTPEGDNELLPDEPLSPSAPVPVRPRGDEPHSAEPLYPALD